jgi:dihydroxyacetone kinase
MIRSVDVLHTYSSWVESWEGELTALDQASGDGDFGDNLRGGLRLVNAEMASSGFEEGSNAMAVAGEVFLDRVGGTSGPLFGLLFQAIGAAVSKHGDGRHAWEVGVADGLAAIQRVGEAEVGDRTMVDALSAAAAALIGGEPLAEVRAVAYRAAAGTADLVARHGRASYVGERARGFPDPGAIGTALLFGALAVSDARDDASVAAELRGLWPRPDFGWLPDT